MGNKLKSNTDKTKLDEAKKLAYEATLNKAEKLAYRAKLNKDENLAYEEKLNKSEKLAYKLWNLLKEQINDMADIPMEKRLSIKKIMRKIAIAEDWTIAVNLIELLRDS